MNESRFGVITAIIGLVADVLALATFAIAASSDEIELGLGKSLPISLAVLTFSIWAYCWFILCWHLVRRYYLFTKPDNQKKFRKGLSWYFAGQSLRITLITAFFNFPCWTIWAFLVFPSDEYTKADAFMNTLGIVLILCGLFALVLPSFMPLIYPDMNEDVA